MGRDGKGWLLVDLWEGKPAAERTGKRWLARAWDPIARGYRSKRWADGEKPQAESWAKREGASFRTGADSTEHASLASIGADYVKELRDTGRSKHYADEVERVIADAVAAGATDMRAQRFGATVRSWLGKATGRPIGHAPPHGEPDTRPLRPLSPASRNLRLRILRAVCQYAVAHRYLLHDPLAAVRTFAEAKELKATFTVAELRALLAPEREADPYFLRFALLAYTGCRIEEAHHLRWEWIDLEQRRVSVRCHPDYALKRAKERTLPLQPELEAILRTARGDHERIGWILPDDVRARTFARNRDFAAYLERCHVERGDRTPHSTRHTWVAMMLATGENQLQVMAWAGHEQLVTTQGYAGTQDSYRDVVKDWPRGELRLRPAAAKAADG